MDEKWLQNVSSEEIRGVDGRGGEAGRIVILYCFYILVYCDSYDVSYTSITCFIATIKSFVFYIFTALLIVLKVICTGISQNLWKVVSSC